MDLKKFGLIPELVGRFPVLTALQPLDRDALKELSGEAAVKDGEVVDTLPPLSMTVFRIAR